MVLIIVVSLTYQSILLSLSSSLSAWWSSQCRMIIRGYNESVPVCAHTHWPASLGRESLKTFSFYKKQANPFFTHVGQSAQVPVITDVCLFVICH